MYTEHGKIMNKYLPLTLKIGNNLEFDRNKMWGISFAIFKNKEVEEEGFETVKEENINEILDKNQITTIENLPFGGYTINNSQNDPLNTIPSWYLSSITT